MVRNKVASLILFVSLLFGFTVGVQNNAQAETLATPPVAVAKAVCASNTICFSDLPNGLPFQGISGNVTRNVWITLQRVNVTSYIENNVGVQWKVSTGGTCGTGNVGTIFSNSSGNMAFPYDNSIDCTLRTSTLLATNNVKSLTRQMADTHQSNYELAG
jgi:hypothetical protein